jgi:hypothetical protein
MHRPKAKKVKGGHFSKISSYKIINRLNSP